MIIDPIDLKLIRQLELHGSIFLTDIIAKFQITKEEILLRVKNLEDSGFIKGYGLKLFIPGIVGGRWYWGCIALETTRQFKPERSVPLLEEIVENVVFPAGVCPQLSLLFYTQSLKDTYKIINKTAGVKYAEIYKIGAYNVKVKQVLLKDDWKLIKKLYEELPTLNYNRINTLINSPSTDDEIKLSRLLWTKKNRKGVVSIFPDFDWSVVKNYLHLHVAVTTNIRIKELRRLINSLGCSGNIASRFKKRYIQLEFDLWGFSEMQSILSSLKQIKRITVEGCSLAYKNRIYNGWIEDYIAQKT
ncbi:MAG TPA: Lrp/AsnC family transcriptional regulator [Thermoplasmata archaeon]|nr:Lrp/AsnC family transcriptional regulator [Thermoplasmata archaeon]